MLSGVHIEKAAIKLPQVQMRGGSDPMLPDNVSLFQLQMTYQGTERELNDIILLQDLKQDMATN